MGHVPFLCIWSIFDTDSEKKHSKRCLETPKYLGSKVRAFLLVVLVYMGHVWV